MGGVPYVGVGWSRRHPLDMRNDGTFFRRHSRESKVAHGVPESEWELRGKMRERGSLVRSSGES
jgi:hypothetical protein